MQQDAYLHLGATLYVPATRNDLVGVARGAIHPDLRSVVLCTEDSVVDRDINLALANLKACLPRLSAGRPLVFVRPRSPEILARILTLPGVGRLTGFVLPKTSAKSLGNYMRLLPPGAPFMVMPTIETREAFDPFELAMLRDALSAPEVRSRVLAVRIGGNDLLNLLGVRRRSGHTIYATPLAATIGLLVAQFRSHGFALTAPVFDDFGDLETLRREVRRDIDHGLIGKTAIHPSQVPFIEQEYRVSPSDLAVAHRVTALDAPAVFQVDRVMWEPATHAAWARAQIARAGIYGVAEHWPAAQDLDPLYAESAAG